MTIQTHFNNSVKGFFVFAVVCTVLFAFCATPKKATQYKVYAYEVQLDTTGKRDVYTLKPLWVKSTSQILKDKQIVVQVEPDN